MSSRDIWNRYADYFNAEETVVFPPDHREMAFYRSLRTDYPEDCLEIGAGSGRLARALLNKGVTVGLEPSDEMVKQWPGSASSLAVRVQGRGEELPFPDSCFQFVCFPYNGLQCVMDAEDRKRIAGEAFRVTAPGGVFVFEISPVFGRREDESWCDRYCSELPDGGSLVLRERVRRCPERAAIEYHMKYVRTDPRGGSIEDDITLELASFGLDEALALVDGAGFTDRIHYGDYDFSDFNEELSPRVLVKAFKGV